jgi:hypothetical protein
VFYGFEEISDIKAITLEHIIGSCFAENPGLQGIN